MKNFKINNDTDDEETSEKIKYNLKSVDSQKSTDTPNSDLIENPECEEVTVNFKELFKNINKSKVSNMNSFLDGFMVSRIFSQQKSQDLQTFIKIQNILNNLAQMKSDSIITQQQQMKIFEKIFEKNPQNLENFIKSELYQIFPKYTQESINLTKVNAQEEQKSNLQEDFEKEQQDIIKDQQLILEQLENERRTQELIKSLYKQEQTVSKEELKQNQEREKREKQDYKTNGCQLCSKPLDDPRYYDIFDCGHIFHNNCLKQYFESKISKNKLPIVCPDKKCKIQVQEFQIIQKLSFQASQKFQQQMMNESNQPPKKQSLTKRFKIF